MTGLAVFAFFAMSGCDPLANRDVQNPNQVCNSYLHKMGRLKMRNVTMGHNIAGLEIAGQAAMGSQTNVLERWKT